MFRRNRPEPSKRNKECRIRELFGAVTKIAEEVNSHGQPWDTDDPSHIPSCISIQMSLLGGVMRVPGNPPAWPAPKIESKSGVPTAYTPTFVHHIGLLVRTTASVSRVPLTTLVTNNLPVAHFDRFIQLELAIKMGAKSSVEAAKINAQNWTLLEGVELFRLSLSAMLLQFDGISAVFYDLIRDELAKALLFPQYKHPKQFSTRHQVHSINKTIGNPWANKICTELGRGTIW
ncbi:hypothetical protein HUJ05_005718 [Dendroctonus ponderosae]|nr:hypothetical protein HUJ05_005718 [Dendroctonus ponderosae]